MASAETAATLKLRKEIRWNRDKGDEASERHDHDKARSHRQAAEEALKRLYCIMKLQTLEAMNELGTVLIQKGKYERAKDVLETVMGIAHKDKGWQGSAAILGARHNAAYALSQLGEDRRAIKIHRVNLHLREKLLEGGPSAKDTILTRYELANCLSKIGEYGEAVHLDRQTLRIKKSIGEAEEECCKVRKNLACNLFYLGEYKEARALFQSNIEARERMETKDSQDPQDYESDSEQWLAGCITAEEELESVSRGNGVNTMLPKESSLPKTPSKDAKNSLQVKQLECSPSRAPFPVDNEACPQPHEGGLSHFDVGDRETVPEKQIPIIIEPSGITLTNSSLAQEASDKSYATPGLQKPLVRRAKSGQDMKPPIPSLHVSKERPITRASRSKSTSSLRWPILDTDNNYPRLFDTRDAHVGDDDELAVVADRWFDDLEKMTQRLLDKGREQDGLSTVGKAIRVAILDTGIDMKHPHIRAYRGRIKGRRSWVDSGKSDEDTCGHGTRAAALVLTIARKAHVYIARVVRDRTDLEFNTHTLAQAIKYASEVWKVDIITMSLGTEQSDEVAKVINFAVANNVTIFAAGSNVGATRTTSVAFPANMKNVIAVGSTNGHGVISDYNPYPRGNLDFNALGECVKASWPEHFREGREKRQSGTSTAAPIAASIAALVLEFVHSEVEFESVSAEGLATVRRRLRTMDGMSTVLSHMVQKDWILPWKLLNVRRGREGLKYSARDSAMHDLCTWLMASDKNM